MSFNVISYALSLLWLVGSHFALHVNQSVKEFENNPCYKAIKTKIPITKMYELKIIFPFLYVY